MLEMWVRSLGREVPLEKEMATHSSILAWRIPWAEEPCRLQSMELQRVGHDWAGSLHFTSYIVLGFLGGASGRELSASAGDFRDMGSILGSGRSPGGGPGNTPQYSCLENPIDRGAWQATVHRVSKSQTQLKQLSTYILVRVAALANQYTPDNSIPSHKHYKGSFQ